MSETATADDFFGALGNDESVDDQTNVLSLRQPPKWLRRPISASFGFGGLLASTSNLPAASGKHHSGVVHLRSVVTEQGILDRATAVHEASGDLDKMRTFYSEKMTDQSDTAWQTLQTLLKANSREELVRLLGFSKEEVASNVAEAIKTFPSTTIDEADIERDPTVPFAEPEKQESKEDASTAQPSEATPSEISASETAATENTAVTDQSLFTDDTPGTPAAAAADFFSSMAAGNLRNPQLDSVIPHKTEGTASSVAATIGSRASSIRSEIKDSNTFRIYPSGESDVDRLITRALVLGDFASAVNLCLASERFADALILAVRGGPELLQSTQTAYFARRTTSLPFLRVFQSIVTEDLVDIVQNADLSEWKVIFVVLCTFARDSDFGNLAEQLGQRLQFKWQMLAGSDSPEAKESAKTARQDATLCYIAARKLEKVVGIWVEEMGEEENQTQATKYTGHAQALQSLIEKVAVFTATTSYVDEDLSTPTESAATAEAGARTYKLAGLYDRYYEYADLLATQGMVDTAAEYVRMTPSDYKGTGVAGFELDKARDRLLSTASGGTGTAPAHGAPPAEQSRQTAAPMSAPGYAPASAPGFPAPAPAPDAAGPASTSGAYNPPNASYETPKHHDPPQSYGYPDPSPYAPSQAYQQSSQYGPSNGYGPPDPQPQGYGVPSSQPYGAPIAPPAPPPRVSANGSNNTSTPPPVPAAQRRDMPGWNDMPSGPPKRPSSAARDAAKPAPIMSPFPMSTDPMAAAGAPQQMQNRGMTPPPPRASQPKMLPPPPRGGPRPPSAQAVAHQASSPHQTQARPPPETGPPSLNAAPTPGVAPRQPAGRGGPPPGVLAGPPPRRALSPLGPQGRVASPLSSQLRSPSSSQPPARVLSPPGQAPPPGSRLAGPPPPGRIPSATQIPPARSASSGTPPQSSPPTKPSHRDSESHEYRRS